MRKDIKAVKVMPEFESCGIWDFDTDYMLDPVEQEIPDEIVKDLCEWISYYDECYTEDYDIPIADKCPKLNEWGLDIAKKIKQAYPTLKVVYMGEDENGVHPIKEINL